MKLTLHFIIKRSLRTEVVIMTAERSRLSWASINTVGVFVTPPDPNIWDWHHLSCVTELSGSGRVSHFVRYHQAARGNTEILMPF